MSRRHRKSPAAAPASMPKPDGKKELERQQRQKAARQRMRFHTLVVLTLMCFDKCRTNDAIKNDVAALPRNEQMFFRMQSGKCHKRVQAVVQMLHDLAAWPAPSSTFFQDASALMIKLLHEICSAPSFPEEATYLDVHAVMTYLCYAALRDWEAMQIMGNDPGSLCRRKEVREMIRNAGIFADHLIPPESPLVKPFNEVYWQTRNMLHAGAPLPDWFGTMKDAGNAVA